MIVTLPFPDKLLWPNGSRGQTRAVAGQKKKHHQWAYHAALAERASFVRADRIGLHITVHAKPRGPLPDRDNVVASVKAYQDGIAQALGIDDKHFATPTVDFANTRTGEFVISVGEAPGAAYDEDKAQAAWDKHSGLLRAMIADPALLECPVWLNAHKSAFSEYLEAMVGSPA